MMTLDILSPEKNLFSGNVTEITIPGTLGYFTVQENHAPIISSLTEGKLTYVTGGKKNVINVTDGFMEMNNNKITVCLESLK